MITLFDRAATWIDEAMAIVGSDVVELFVRSTRRLRVSRTFANIAPRVVEGVETGLALRVVDASGREGFDSTSIDPECASIRPHVERLLGVPRARGDRRSWRLDPVTLTDVEDPLTLPEEEEATAWLDRAIELLGERLRESDPGSPEPTGWVECGATVEALVNGAGLRAFRSRRRAWAMALYRGRALPDAPERPRFLSARQFHALDAGTWAEDLDEAPVTARLAASPAGLPWVLTPEAAASLVPAVVTALHGSGSPENAEVGPGWRIEDVPDHADGLVGGKFDDAGYPSGATILADRGRSRGRLEGPGFFRRGSFRDPPAPAASTIVVRSTETERPEEFYRVRALRILPLGAGRWVLEVDGVRRRGDEAGEILQAARATTTPLEIARACRGTLGSARAAGWGIVTPGIVLDGLRFE